MNKSRFQEQLGKWNMRIGLPLGFLSVIAGGVLGATGSANLPLILGLTIGVGGAVTLLFLIVVSLDY